MLTEAKLICSKNEKAKAGQIIFFNPTGYFNIINVTFTRKISLQITVQRYC